MARKTRNKRLRKKLSDFFLKYDKEVAAIDELSTGCRAGLPLLEKALGFVFTLDETNALLSALVVAHCVPLYDWHLTIGKKPQACGETTS